MKVSYGDVVALSGDWFGSIKQLQDLAKVNGKGRGTREEVEYVLTVEIHGHKDKEKDFSDGAITGAKSRYYKLASDNTAHFLNPHDGDAQRDPQAAARRDREGQAVRRRRQLPRRTIATRSSRPSGSRRPGSRSIRP